MHRLAVQRIDASQPGNQVKVPVCADDLDAGDLSHRRGVDRVANRQPWNIAQECQRLAHHRRVHTQRHRDQVEDRSRGLKRSWRPQPQRSQPTQQRGLWAGAPAPLLTLPTPMHIMRAVALEACGLAFMPTISQFYGIVIRMFYNDHAPPHFHAQYGDAKATIDIARLEVLEGELPRRARQLVLDWAELHQGELQCNWDLCASRRAPVSIAPLR